MTSEEKTQKPTLSVQGPSLTLARRAEVRVATAADLDDATIEELSRGFIERWRPQMKISFLSVGIALGIYLLAQAAAAAHIVPALVASIAVLPLFSLTPAIMWRQRRMQHEEADRLGVSRKIVNALWKKQVLMGFRPRVMRDVLNALPRALSKEQRQLEMTMKYLRLARDELAAKERKLSELSGSSNGRASLPSSDEPK